MSKNDISQKIQSLFRHFVLVSAILFSFAGSVAAVDTESRTIFTAPMKGGEETSIRNTEAALHLGTFKIPSSQGRITFLDETPLAQTPSISIVVVENSEFSTLADARHSGASALELFMAFAPPGKKIPERLNLYAELLRAGDVSDSSKAKTISTLRLHGTSAAPNVGPDNWGDLGSCAVKEDWDAGFTNWVNSFSFGFWGFGSSLNESVHVPHATQAYGYLGLNDAIWVGVCMRTPSSSKGESFMGVSIQYLNSSTGNWENVSSTAAKIYVGERYLYHSFKPYTPQRRVKVSSVNEGEADGGDGNTAFISAKWKDNFSPDSTEAAP